MATRAAGGGDGARHGKAMTTFDEREKGFESKYKREQELEFKALARRNRLLGLWAAELLGFQGEAAAAYAKEVVASDFDRPGDEDVLEKVLGDFESKQVQVDARRLRKKMDELLEEAREQVKRE